MAPTTTTIALQATIGLLMVVSIIELAFVSSMVAWLQSTASQGFVVRPDNGGAAFRMAGAPVHLEVNQGHTSNGAAGTAFVLIGCGGILALCVRGRGGRGRRGAGAGNIIYYLWLALTVPALLLTAGALGYVFDVTNAHAGQTIDMSLLLYLGDAPYKYQTWTPQNWFAAVLRLDLVDDSSRADIQSHYDVMRGWQYNLIPFFLVQLAQTVLAFVDFLRWRRRGAGTGAGVGKTDYAMEPQGYGA